MHARFTTAPASAIEPSTRYTRAPYAAVSRWMTSGVVAGITTMTPRPARAPYAAQAAPALPAVGSAIVVAPSSRARVTPTAAPRALNVPVGSNPSSLMNSRCMPSDSRSVCGSTIGVFPSPRVTALFGSSIGSSSRYRQSDACRPASIERGTERSRSRS